MNSVPVLDSLVGESVVVIGSGFDGLSAACYPADIGVDVALLGKNE